MKTTSTASTAYLLFVGFCSFNAGAAEELIDRIVAVVNNDVISLSDLNRTIAPMLAAYTQQKGQELTDAERGELLKKAIDQLVEKKLIEQKAKEFDIKVSTRILTVRLKKSCREITSPLIS